MIKDLNTKNSIEIRNFELKICFLGTPTFVQPVKQALSEHFTLVEKPAEADLLVVAAYGKILSPKDLSTPKFGGLNIHPSLLPKYRGPSPIQQALLNGDKETGVTIIKMDEEVDHGPILARESLKIEANETFLSLAEKAFKIGAQMLIKSIPDYIEGKIELKEQDHERASFCEMIQKKDGFFEIDNPPDPQSLDRMIRAYYPWPSAWTRWKGKIIKLLPQSQIQMEGKKVTKLEDFLRGYPDFPLKELLATRV